jgi:ABC-type amino acid transport system permease subunit
MTSVQGSAPAAIDAVPLRHPWRWVGAGAIVVLVGLFIYGAATNKAYGWSTYGEYLFNDRILLGVWNTLQLTVYAMAIGVVLGIVMDELDSVNVDQEEDFLFAELLMQRRAAASPPNPLATRPAAH